MSDTTAVDADQRILVLVAQAEETARLVHDARQRADDDASYAHKAKTAAEEHSKAVASLKGQAEADASWFTTTKQNADEARTVITQIRTEVESAKAAIGTSLSELEKLGASATSSAERIGELKGLAEQSAADAASQAKAAAAVATTATESGQAIGSARTKAEKLVEEIAAQADTAKEHAAETETALNAVKAAQESAETIVATMSAASKKAAQVLEALEQHESDLARIKGECDALHSRIESLLPNATSAGLATAFRNQQARFVWPQRGWLCAFITAIVGLLFAGFVGLPTVDGSWDMMARHFMNRLPLIAPLIWLAVYAGRHYNMALRLQEEYAFKEAVSAAFEGYKREMTSVASSAGGSAGPLVTLCESVLRTLAQRPGRIYEGKHEDITALTPLTTAIKDGVQAAGVTAKGQSAVTTQAS